MEEIEMKTFAFNNALEDFLRSQIHLLDDDIMTEYEFGQMIAQAAKATLELQYSTEFLAGLVAPFNKPEFLARVISELNVTEGQDLSKTLALDTAEKLSYEKGQLLYRFIVLVTRLIANNPSEE